MQGLYLQRYALLGQLDHSSHAPLHLLVAELGQQDCHEGLQVGCEQVLLHRAGAGHQADAALQRRRPHNEVAQLVDQHSVAAPLVHGHKFGTPGHHVLVCRVGSIQNCAHVLFLVYTAWPPASRQVIAADVMLAARRGPSCSHAFMCLIAVSAEATLRNRRTSG